MKKKWKNNFKLFFMLLSSTKYTCIEQKFKPNLKFDTSLSLKLPLSLVWNVCASRCDLIRFVSSSFNGTVR